MNHPEAFYIEAGYRYERMSVSVERIKRAQALRDLIAAEPASDQHMVRSLIQRGRQEYQQRGRA